VKEIIRGDKRKILEILIESDGNYSQEKFNVQDVNTSNSENVRTLLLESGLWPLISQRPYGVIACPKDIPDKVFVSAFDSSPLAPDLDYVTKGMEDDLKKGIEVIQSITGREINIGISVNSNQSIYNRFKNTTVHSFQGPHPVGNVGVQINKISPINKNEIFWTLKLQNLEIIGRFFRTGQYDMSRIIALTGSELVNKKYVKIISGQSVKPLLYENLLNENVRVISGNVLTGKNIGKTGFLSFNEDQISVIPEGDHFDMFGWITPGFKKFSVSRTFPSWLLQKREYQIDTNLHGGERSYVMTGEYEKVCPMDIYPLQLIKACIVKDIDQMEALGIYEVVEEDLALCEFVCTSKTPVQKILRESLNMLRKEMSDA
jgi:Na+-transporting NADH:ubiquinone oxidoreductase subunit A